jgi:hypothetical protein
VAIDWSAIFDKLFDRPPGATAADLAVLTAALERPMSPEEVREHIAWQKNPWPVNYPEHATFQPIDPTGWPMPGAVLPESYLELLRWSNGPHFRTGERELAFLGCGEMRDYLVNYQFPEYMPGAIPLGLDGGSLFAAFDTRGGLIDGEFPILVSAAGNLDYVDARVVASSLVEFCRGTNPIAEVLHPPGPEPTRVDIYLVAAPPGGVKQLFAIKERLALPHSPAELLAAARVTPARLCRGRGLLALDHVRALNEQGVCLKVTEMDAPSKVLLE